MLDAAIQNAVEQVWPSSSPQLAEFGQQFNSTTFQSDNSSIRTFQFGQRFSSDNSSIFGEQFELNSDYSPQITLKFVPKSLEGRGMPQRNSL